MQWQPTPYVLLLFVAAAVSLLWVAYGADSARRKGWTATIAAFVVLCLSVSIWAGIYAIQLATPTLEAKLFAYRLLHVGAAVTAPAWFAFTLAYTGRAERLTPITIGALAIVPVTLVVTMATNPYSLALTDATLSTAGSLTRLVTTNGPVYQLHLAVSYVLIVAGVGLVSTHAIRSGRSVRRGDVLLVLGAAIPLVINVFHVFSVPPFDVIEVNLTPVSLSLSTALFGIAVFRYRVLDLTPIASRVVLEEMSDGVIVLNAEETIVDLNPAAERVLADHDEVLGGDVSVWLPEYDRLDGAESILMTLHEGDRDRFLQLNRSPLERAGERYGWVVLIQDVTTIELQRRELEEQNERLDEFTRIVSHDLRNPLSVIAGYAEFASETGEKQHFDVIQRTVTNMTEFLEDLLELSRRGETVTEPETVSLAGVVAEVEAGVRDDDLTVVTVDDADVLADPRRLKQVFDNLFRNARDHADDLVTVTVGTLPDGFYVEDDGPGIEPERREEVFDVGVTTSGTGTGLGLAIVRDIVEAHGWSIAVVEGREGGARFEITGVEFIET